MSALSSATSTSGRLAALGGRLLGRGLQPAQRLRHVARRDALDQLRRRLPASPTACASPSGTRTTKRLPRPGSLSTWTLPPCSAASSATRARPMPEPSYVRERASTTRWKRSKSRAWSARGIPMPVSATASCAKSPLRGDRDVDPALEGELQRVRDEVEHDLGPHLAVDVDRSGQRRAVDGERQPGAVGPRSRTWRSARRCSGRGRPAPAAGPPGRSRAGRSRGAC